MIQMNGTALVLSTSLRTRPPEALATHQAELMRYCGISRLTEITRLDKIGLPVFVSIRPRAALLCVNAGKGLEIEEARASGLMEAVEFAMAERAAGKVRSLTPDEYANTTGGSVLDFCPPVGAAIPRNEPLDWVEGVDMSTGETTVSPLELVHIALGRPIVFGSDTTGLASGWTIAEAALHALLEIAERDVKSSVLLGADTTPIILDSLHGRLKDITGRIAKAGLSVALLRAENPFGLPWFQSTIWDPRCPDPRFVNAGYGCHIFPEIAATRAMLEAVQSRLVYIHGGRDDLGESWRSFAKLSGPQKRIAALDRIARAQGSGTPGTIAEGAWGFPSATPTIEALLEQTKGAFRHAGLRRLSLHDLTPPDFPVKVVRVIVPGAENFTNANRKLGNRLLKTARKMRLACVQ